MHDQHYDIKAGFKKKMVRTEKQKRHASREEGLIISFTPLSPEESNKVNPGNERMD